MNAVKIILLVVLLALTGILAGCQESYTNQSNTMSHHHQRADGLRFMAY